MLLRYKCSPVYKPVPLVVGIRVNLDGNDKHLGNVYLVIYRMAQKERKYFISACDFFRRVTSNQKSTFGNLVQSMI